MRSDPMLERIRAANPAPVAPARDNKLFESIVSSPGDPRITAPPRRMLGRRRWLKMGSRQLGIVLASVILGGAGATAAAIKLGAFSNASPRGVFELNPQANDKPAWRQQVLPGTIHRAETLTVPRVGRFEYWIAQSTQHWLCEAIRLPDGSWVGTAKRPTVGGPLPGCLPPPHTCSICVTRLIGGFYYDRVEARAPGGRLWRIEYGVALPERGAVVVRDAISGTTTPIIDGRYFAIVLPVRALVPPTAKQSGVYPFFQLETIDASGHVLSKGRVDRGM